MKIEPRFDVTVGSMIDFASPLPEGILVSNLAR